MCLMLKNICFRAALYTKSRTFLGGFNPFLKLASFVKKCIFIDTSNVKTVYSRSKHKICHICRMPELMESSAKCDKSLEPTISVLF